MGSGPRLLVLAAHNQVGCTLGLVARDVLLLCGLPAHPLIERVLPVALEAAP